MKHVIDRRNHNMMPLKIEGTEIKFIVDATTPPTIIPQDKETLKNQKVLTMSRKYRDL